MSMPNIPNITPIIDIDREKVVNMLMASIAMEEMGLSHIITAESEKIKYVLNKGKCNQSSVREIKEINESVEKVMRNVMKIQFLLQEKLEDVISIIPKEEEHPDPCCNECQYEKCEPECSLVGNGYGLINNKLDPFNCGTFNIVSNIQKINNCFNLSFKYSIFKKTRTSTFLMILLAIPESLSINCMDDLRNCNNINEHTTLIVKGKGVMSLTSRNCTLEQSTVSFICTILDYQYFQKIKMVINSCDMSIIHNSDLAPITSGHLKINK